MRFLTIGLLAAIAFLADARSVTQAAPWCLFDKLGGTNCGFQSFGQCLSALRGVGGQCIRNPAERAVERLEPGRPRAARTRVEPKAERKKALRREPAPVVKRAPRPAAPAVASPPHAPAPAVGTPAPASPTEVAKPTPPEPTGPTPPPSEPATTSVDRSTQYDLAYQSIVEGRYEDAIAALLALGLDDHPDVANLMGFALHKLARFEEARVWYGKALAADPNHLATLTAYGMLDAETGNLRAARSRLAKIRVVCGGTTCSAYRDLQDAIARGRR